MKTAANPTHNTSDRANANHVAQAHPTGPLPFTDHRPEARVQQHRQALANRSPQTVAQRKLQRTLDQSPRMAAQHTLHPTQRQSKVVQRGSRKKRPSGISTKLARARWNMKSRPHYNFKQWKRGYEAQHIIPWAVANKLGLPMKHINEAWNGMMLPSGRKGAAKPVYKANSRFQQRPRHIKKGISHPYYSKNVESYIKGYMKRKGRDSLRQRHLERIARRLRRATKDHDSKGFIDDMDMPKK